MSKTDIHKHVHREKRALCIFVKLDGKIRRFQMMALLANTILHCRVIDLFVGTWPEGMINRILGKTLP